MAVVMADIRVQRISSGGAHDEAVIGDLHIAVWVRNSRPLRLESLCVLNASSYTDFAALEWEIRSHLVASGVTLIYCERAD